MPVGSYEHGNALRLREHLRTDTYVDKDGGIHWNMGNFVPPSVFREACCDCPPEHETAYKAGTAKFLKAYHKQERNRVPSDEERYEMRAAFGSGATVVNVFTGRRTRT